MKTATPRNKAVAMASLDSSKLINPSFSACGLSSDAVDATAFQKICSEAHVRIQVNDLVAYEYVDTKTHNWRWGLGTVSALPGPRLAQLMLWKGNSGAQMDQMPPTVSPISAAERAAALKRLNEIESKKGTIARDIESVNAKLTVAKVEYDKGRERFQRDLEEAAVTLRQAQTDVQAVDEASWREIRSYVKPPKIVELVVSATIVALGSTTTGWQDAQRILRAPNFVRRISEHDPAGMTPAIRKRVRAYTNDPNFTYENAMKGSRALGALLRWVTAQVATSTAVQKAVHFDVEHKNQKADIDELGSTLRRYHGELDTYDQEESGLREKLGDKPISARAAADSPASRGAGSSTTGGKTVHGGSSTWTFTDTSLVVLRSSILVNYGRTSSTSITLEPGQVARLRAALVARAANEEQEAQAAAQTRALEKELEACRGELADTKVQLFDLKAAANDHTNALAAAEAEMEELRAVAVKPGPPAKSSADKRAAKEDKEIELLKVQVAEARKEAAAAAASPGTPGNNLTQSGGNTGPHDSDGHDVDLRKIIRVLQEEATRLHSESDEAMRTMKSVGMRIDRHRRLKALMALD